MSKSLISQESPLFTEIQSQEMEVISGGAKPPKASEALGSAEFRRGCKFYDEDIVKEKGKFYLKFCGKCPIKFS